MDLSLVLSPVLAAAPINEEALALSPTAGWILLAALVSLAAIFVVQRERWRRWWLTAEDPRTLGAFRLVFGFFLIANVNGMWEHFTFLFTDEGIFPADVARQVFASGQYAGFGDGFGPTDPWGFFDPLAVMQMLRGPKYSLLYIWDSPAFFWGYIIAFQVVAAAFMLGFRTRLMGVLTFLLMNGLFVRNHLFWEGTELVYRCFLAYLVVSRCGAAYSVDNWLRCRKLRAKGELSEPGRPGEGAGAPSSPELPRGLQPIYRAIPAWPRRLLMLQVATIYLTTGSLKTGAVWMRGDSLYYALNLDHFYRFPPQFTSYLFGTTLFPALTWSVKIGQVGFCLVLLGLIWRWASRQPRLSSRETWGVRLATAGLIASVGALIHVLWPVHFTPNIPRQAFVATYFLVAAGLWAFIFRLTHRPLHVGSHILDRDWFSRWFLGRRVWLLWHVGFHAHIFTLMNVGQFQTGMLSATLVFLEGTEIARVVRGVHRLGRRLVGKPTVDAPIIPAQDPTLVKNAGTGTALPPWALGVALAGIVSGIVVKSVGPSFLDFKFVWGATAAFVLGVHVVVLKRSAASASPQPVAWAYGAAGRLVVGILVIWHLCAVAVWLMPDKASFRSFRGPARAVVAKWLTMTTTDQGWGMFAPNPPRSNVFLKVLVTDQSGEVWDLKTDVYAAEQKPIPWIWNDRQRKMNRRIIGGESGPTQWYRKWHARYHCRKWQLDHEGEIPKKVELIKIWYQIPSPQEVRDHGYYVAEDLLARSGHEKLEYTEHCQNAIMGQLPNHVRRRHGLPDLPESIHYRAWHKNKQQAWERRRKRDKNK